MGRRNKKLKIDSLRDQKGIRDIFPAKGLRIPMPDEVVVNPENTFGAEKHKGRKSVNVARRIFKELMDLVTEDMVENNIRFVPPVQGCGSMFIGLVEPYKGTRFVNMHSDGKIYQGKWRFRMMGQWAEYRFKFNEYFRFRMKDKIINEEFNYWQI